MEFESMVTEDELYERIADLEKMNYQLQDENAELKSEIEHLKEKIEQMEQDIEDNYRRIDIATQVGVTDSDFI